MSNARNDMGGFLITATDAAGKRDTLRIEAINSQEACRQLEEIGYRDIVLHTGDAETSGLSSGSKRDDLTPADLLQLRASTRLGFFLFAVKKLYWQARLPAVICLGILAFNLATSHTLGYSGAIVIALLCVPLLLALHTTLFGISFRYNKLQAASAWGRWDEVLKLAPRFYSDPTGFDARVRECCALVGLGRVDEALKRMEELRSRPGTPKWQYLGRLAELLALAHRYDEQMECCRLACEDAPDNSAVQLAYALALLRSERELPLAARLLTELAARKLSDLETMFLPHGQGMYALSTGKAADAKRCFQLADAGFSQLVAAVPAVGPARDANRAYLAIALAKLNERAEAEQQFKLARPRLVALNSTRLLRQAEEALGHAN